MEICLGGKGLMPGTAKRKYVGECIRIAKSMTRPLNLITEILKPGFSEQDLLEAYKKYYPFEWKELCERQRLYTKKDAFLRKQHKKMRYRPPTPEKYFFSLPKVKHIMSYGFRKKHESEYNEEMRRVREERFELKRKNRINGRTKRIEDYTKNQQNVTPDFIEALIYAYHDKRNTINDKIEIFREIQKYDCAEAWRFFGKLNDSERNNKIRKLAFEHLQKGGHYVKLRQFFKGKKKSYYTEEDTFFGTPQALIDKLTSNNSVQNKKAYDLFLSHSSCDNIMVKEIVKLANKLNLVCYVDWLSDNDFLKRSMVSEYTKEVLKFRMQQSERLLYLSSENSRKSTWVSFELEYFQDVVQRDVRMILLDGKEELEFKNIKFCDLDSERLRLLLK